MVSLLSLMSLPGLLLDGDGSLASEGFGGSLRGWRHEDMLSESCRDGKGRVKAIG